MRFASGLLVVTLLTMSIISGTFAKYTTKASGENTARVAKWGVVASVSNDMFGEMYKHGANGNVVTDTDGNEISVKSSQTGTNVVAPGTKGNVFSLKLTGTPEVDGEVTASIFGKNIGLEARKYVTFKKYGKITEEEYNNTPNDWFVHLSEYPKRYYISNAYSPEAEYYKSEVICDLSSVGAYYPIVFTVNGTLSGYTNPATHDAAVKTDTLANISKIFNAQYLKTKAKFKAGSNISTTLNIPTISWEWAFCSSDPNCNGYDLTPVYSDTGNNSITNVTVTEACERCKADTLLGDLIAGTVAKDSVFVSGGQGEIIDAPGVVNSNRFYSLSVINLELTFDANIVVNQLD